MYNFPLLGEFFFDSHRGWIVKTSLPENVYTRRGRAVKHVGWPLVLAVLDQGRGETCEVMAGTGGTGGGEGGVH